MPINPDRLLAREFASVEQTYTQRDTMRRPAGFSRPILHGMCTMGVAMHAVLMAVLGYDASRVRGMRVRFTAPVLPGETLRTENPGLTTRLSRCAPWHWNAA